MIATMKPKNDFWPQMGRYMVTTALVIVTDMGLYWALSLWFTPALSKGVSFCIAAVLAFALNKYWTFSRPENLSNETPASPETTQTSQHVRRFLVLNALSLLGNILSNQAVISACTPGLRYNSAKALGLLAAVCFSTIFNYFGQKYWVFK